MAPQASPSVSRKRKNTDEAEDGRAVKHRASLACQSCRTRKVRCDVLANGSRCTNCRLDQLECVVVPSRRGKNNRASNGTAALATQSKSTKSTNSTVESGITTNDAWIAPNGSAGPVVSFDDEGNEDANDTLSDHPFDRDNATTAELSPYAGLVSPETRPDNFLQRQDSTEEVTLPAFIAPPSRHVLSEDIDYLARKGALKVPERDLQVEILRAYLFSVHPFMPMLDYRDFVHAVLNNHGDHQVSLLLFQAVMFAGVHSLQLHTVHRLGFESTKQARSVFFNRVRLLYEFDVEQDLGAVVQSLVLMSSWYSKWDGRRDTWHWTGLAYDTARRMGLHREPTRQYSSDKVRHFRRRLWWSLYIRDRLIALGTRRPMRIHENEFDVAMLTLDDFDLEPFEESYQGQSMIPSVKENRETALMCIELAKLGMCIENVVSSQYTTIRTQADQDIPHTVMVVSRRDEGRKADLESCNQELNEWFEAMNRNVQPTALSAAQSCLHSCSEVHWQVLNMTYQSAINVLHRTQALKPTSNTGGTATEPNPSRLKVKESARSMTKLLQSMLRRDQLRFLGLIGVTAAIAAYLSHLLDATAADEDVRDASTLRIYQSFEILQAFRQIYASADAAISFLASVSAKAGISIPMHIAGHTGEPTFSSNTKLVPASNDGQASGSNKTHVLPTIQSHAHQPGWQISPHQARAPSANTYMQQPVLDRDGQILAAGSLMQVRPNTITFPASDNNRISGPGTSNPTPTQRPFSYLVDPTIGALSNSTGNGVLSTWDISMDNSMDSMEPTSFNYDFYADAFGLSDGDF